MKVTYGEVGQVYIELREGKVAKTRERPGNILVDVDEKGEVLGIEIVFGEAATAAQLLAVLKEFGLDEKLVMAA